MRTKPGEFGQRHGNELRVPEGVARLALAAGLSDAFELFSWADAYPSATGDVLGWTATEVRAAVVALSKLLPTVPRGSVPDLGRGVSLPQGVVPNVTTAADLAKERKER